MTEEGTPPSKRVKLGKGHLERLSKEELLQRCEEQTAYINSLSRTPSEKAKSKEVAYLHKSEEILGATRPENLPTYKRQELQGSLKQNEEDLQNLERLCTPQLHPILPDSANNLLPRRMKEEVDSCEEEDEMETDRTTSKFTPNRQTSMIVVTRSQARPSNNDGLLDSVSSEENAGCTRETTLPKIYGDEAKTSHVAFGCNGYLYADKDMTTRIAQPIYKSKNNYYYDEDLSTTLEIVNIDDVCIDEKSLVYDSPRNSEVSPRVNMDSNMYNEVSGDEETVGRNDWDIVDMDRKLDVHEMWTPEETKYLIMIIRDFVTDNQEDLPKTLTELETKIRRGRGKQRAMWLEITEKLKFTFMKQFDVKRVARKWQTLTDGLKKVLLIRSKTGKTTSKFGFLSEMMELIDNSQDIKSVLTGTQGHTKSKPEELSREAVHLKQKSQSDNPESTGAAGCERTAMSSELNQSSDGERVSPIPSPSTFSTDGETSRNDEGTASPVPCSSTVRSRKRNRTEQSDDALLQYLRESDARMQERQDQILQEMTEFRGSFISMFDQLLKKM